MPFSKRRARTASLLERSEFRMMMSGLDRTALLTSSEPLDSTTL